MGKKILISLIIAIVIILLGLLIVHIIINKKHQRTYTSNLTFEKAPAETHKGDLIIDGNQVYTIENKQNFHVDGNITVKDNAKLIIKNTKLTLDITSFSSYWVEVQDNASVEVDHSILDRALKTNVNFRMAGQALTLKNSQCYWDISAEKGDISIVDSDIIGSNGVFWKGYQGVNLTLDNSHVKIIELSFLNSEPESVTLEGLKPGLKEKYILQTKGGSALSLVNTTIDGWVVEQFEFADGQSNKVDLTIKDSEIYLWLWFGPETHLTAKNFKPGFFSDWELAKNVDAQSVNYQVHLINTTIGGPQVAQIKLLIAGAADLDDVEAQIGTWGRADVTVNNSQIKMGLMLRGDEIIRLNNSALASGDIEFIDGRKFIPEIGGANHKVYFSNTKIITKNAFEVACEESFIIGDVTFDGPKLGKINWDHGNVTREYDLTALPNTDITLYNQNNQITWQGKTAGDGTVQFEIKFDKENFKQTWRLETSEKKQKINFLTNTPIKM